MGDFLIQLIPTMTIQALLLIGVVPLSRKVRSGSSWVWIVATLIPVVGLLVFTFLMMKALAVILEKLDLLSEKVGSLNPAIRD